MIEILVAAMTASVLVSLAVPAVQKARNDARDTAAVNRMKKLGLALHNYHDVFLTFPPGWVSRDMNGPGHPSTGWHVMLLPFAGEAVLFNSMNLFTNTVYEQDAAGLAVLKQDMKIYRSPDDGLEATNPAKGGWGSSSYVGNFGATAISREKPEKRKRGRAVSDGIFWVNSKIGLRDIIDGTTNTFLVGERCVTGKGAIWPGPRSNYHETDVVADGNHASPVNSSETGYSSNRDDGRLLFLMCDGAVRTIGKDIDSKPKWGVLQKLSARNNSRQTGDF